MLREGVWLKISLWLSFPKRGPDGTPASPAVKSGETSNRAVVPGRFIPMAGDLAHGDQLPGMGEGAPPTDLVFIHFGASRTRSRVKPTTSRARRQVNPFVHRYHVDREPAWQRMVNRRARDVAMLLVQPHPGKRRHQLERPESGPYRLRRLPGVPLRSAQACSPQPRVRVSSARSARVMPERPRESRVAVYIPSYGCHGIQTAC